MTATRETIPDSRLVTPEPDNQHEASILEEIESHYCKLDNANFAFLANWVGWQSGNDIGKQHLDESLQAIINAAEAIRSNIAQLEERRIRDEYDEHLEVCAERIRGAADEMSRDLDSASLPEQIDRIESTLQALRNEFELFI